MYRTKERLYDKGKRFPLLPSARALCAISSLLVYNVRKEFSKIYKTAMNETHDGWRARVTHGETVVARISAPVPAPLSSLLPARSPRDAIDPALNIPSIKRNKRRSQ